MKISVLTPTYNRAHFLKKLYNSLLENSKYDVEIEWLIMNDGSTDETRDVVKNFLTEKKITVKYFEQENQGKMSAINNLIEYVSGDLIIECDSDDYFTSDAFKIISDNYRIDENHIYALCFLKLDYNRKENMGNKFKNNRTTMFDLYFKEGENGEKALVFYANIRKKYKYELKNEERFITEASMYHRMDQKYQILCINQPIMICEYQENGYTKNILKEFKENPCGFYEYFKEIFDHNMSGVPISKRLYVIKHYILFSYLSKKGWTYSQVKGLNNKLLYILLYIPGTLKTMYMFRKKF